MSKTNTYDLRNTSDHKATIGESRESLLKFEKHIGSGLFPKNSISYIRSFLFASIMMFAFGCSQINDEVMDTPIDNQTSSKIAQDDTSNNPAARMAFAKKYLVSLGELNESGVSGIAELMLTGNELNVKVYAQGLEPNLPHPQHIHGFDGNKGNATCPPSSADTNEDGVISVGEGAPFYGPILLPLLNSDGELPIADENGDLDFERTFILGDEDLITESDLSPLQNRVIVLHGLTVDEAYIPTLPVACGQIMPNQGRN